MELALKGWLWQKCLQLSLFCHSLLPHSILCLLFLCNTHPLYWSILLAVPPWHPLPQDSTHGNTSDRCAILIKNVLKAICTLILPCTQSSQNHPYLFSSNVQTISEHHTTHSITPQFNSFTLYPHQTSHTFITFSWHTTHPSYIPHNTACIYLWLVCHIIHPYLPSLLCHHFHNSSFQNFLLQYIYYLSAIHWPLPPPPQNCI